MKSLTSTYIEFSLLSIPVKVYPIRSNQDKLSFIGISDCCNKEVGLKKYCKECNFFINWKTNKKGYRLGKNTYIILTNDELNSIEKLTNKINILYFTKDIIDDSYLSTPYFLEPEQNKKLYFLFSDLFATLNAVAICRTIIKGSEHFSILRHDKKGLILQYIEKITDLTIEMEKVNSTSDEENMLKGLIKENLKEFKFDELKNTYIEKAKELIKAKSEGKTIEIISKAVRQLDDTKLIDTLKLMSKKKKEVIVR